MYGSVCGKFYVRAYKSYLHLSIVGNYCLILLGMLLGIRIYYSGSYLNLFYTSNQLATRGDFSLYFTSWIYWRHCTVYNIYRYWDNYSKSLSKILQLWTLL